MAPTKQGPTQSSEVIHKQINLTHKFDRGEKKRWLDIWSTQSKPEQTYMYKKIHKKGLSHPEPAQQLSGIIPLFPPFLKMPGYMVFYQRESDM